MISFIKLYDPSILTTVSLIGLLVLLCEYAVPMLTSYLFKQSDWDTTADLKYTRICERLSNLYEHVISSKNKLEKIRKEKQSLYFILMFFFLICCAYIGQCIDNVLLTYLAGILLLLLLLFEIITLK